MGLALGKQVGAPLKCLPPSAEASHEGLVTVFRHKQMDVAQEKEVAVMKRLNPWNSVPSTS